MSDNSVVYAGGQLDHATYVECAQAYEGLRAGEVIPDEVAQALAAMWMDPQHPDGVRLAQRGEVTRDLTISDFTPNRGPVHGNSDWTLKALAAYIADRQGKGPHYRWIAYFGASFVDGGLAGRFVSLPRVVAELREFAEAIGADEPYARVYPCDDTAWAEALEYAEIGCPFNYSAKVIERGARGAWNVSNA